MKIPCEIVAKDILPMIRRELSIELVSTHEISQADVAKLLDLTDAAISQYVRKKRGGSEEYRKLPQYKDFHDELVKSANIVAKGGDTTSELCRLCGVAKGTGLLAAIYTKQTGCNPPTCVR